MTGQHCIIEIQYLYLVVKEKLGEERILGEGGIFIKNFILKDFKQPCFLTFQTTLAHIIANSAKRSNKARFVQLSATTSGINDVKEVVKVAKNEQQMFKRKTILFVDEIHRFNKLQQVCHIDHRVISMSLRFC